MSGTDGTGAPPRAILLATDLSCRCDRAFDRALALSRAWNARLVVLHVIEPQGFVADDRTAPSWRRPSDPVGHARRQLLADIGPAIDRVEIMIAEGEPGDEILAAIATRGIDLVVTGVARDEPFGRFLLGTTVDRLVRRSPVPVLVVRNRARKPYARIGVATDFSDASLRTLETVASWLPDAPLTILHASDPPLGGLSGDRDESERQALAGAASDYAAFLARVAGGEAIGRRAKPVIMLGSPVEVLKDGVRDFDVDLLAIGAHGRSALFELLIGSVARTVLAEADLGADVLVVREAPPAAPG